MTAAPELSLFHKILILTEDQGDVTLKDLEQFGNSRQMLGALGRLEGLKLISRTKENDDIVITLTEKGNAFLDDILAYLPTGEEEWSGKWHIILFDIPESSRSVRQFFRLKLIDLGARMLQSSVWIATDGYIKDRFQEIIEETEFKHAVHFFAATQESSNPIDVNKLWNLDQLEKEYNNLFKFFETTLKKLPKDKDASFTAKCLLAHLALLRRKDPRLPADMMPANWIGAKSEAWYKKLRIHCQ